MGYQRTARVGNYQLFNLAGKLYVADYNSIQQITHDARGTSCLPAFSANRQSPAWIRWARW